MLKALHSIHSALRGLLEDPDVWQTLDINYEPPHVERLWLQYHPEYRLYVHLIHPCDTALFHPHPWPSAVMILEGSYEMAIGFGESEAMPPVAATTILTAGSSYEMLDPDAWHSVRPLEQPSLSIMLTGLPFEFYHPCAHVGKGIQHKPLSELRKQHILQRALACVP
jgi:hypothetical protein